MPTRAQLQYILCDLARLRNLIVGVQLDCQVRATCSESNPQEFIVSNGDVTSDRVCQKGTVVSVLACRLCHPRV